MVVLLPNCSCGSSEVEPWGISIGAKAVLWKKIIFIKFLLVIKYASYGPAIWPTISFFLPSTGLNLTSPSPSKWNVSVNLWVHLCYEVSKDRFCFLTEFFLPGKKLLQLKSCGWAGLLSPSESCVASLSFAGLGPLCSHYSHSPLCLSLSTSLPPCSIFAQGNWIRWLNICYT